MSLPSNDPPGVEELMVVDRALLPANLYDFGDVMTVEECARVLRVSRDCAYNAIRRGQLPAVRVGRHLRIPRITLETWMRRAGELEIINKETD